MTETTKNTDGSYSINFSGCLPGDLPGTPKKKRVLPNVAANRTVLWILQTLAKHLIDTGNDDLIIVANTTDEGGFLVEVFEGDESHLIFPVTPEGDHVSIYTGMLGIVALPYELLK